MDLVVIHNDFNNVSLKGLKEKELDLLISLCYKLRDEGIEEVKLPFDELKKLSKYEGKDNQRFVKDLDNVYKKLIELNFKYEDENKIIRFVLFKSYEIDKNEKIVTIAVNEKFKYVLNQLTGNFTKFELNQFVNLTSQYSKHIFRLLKQFSETGWREFLLSDFRSLLGIPEKYRISEIDKKVLNEKIIEELKKSFTNLKVLKIKKGREVYKIRFEWDVITLLPPKKEKKGKEIEKTTKEINTDNIIKKQSEDIELGEIINRKIDEKYNEYLQLAEQIKVEIDEKVYKKYLEKSNAKDNKIIRGIFEKSKKSLIVQEYEEYLEEPQEEIEIIQGNENISFLTREEKKLILNYRKQQEKAKIITDHERFDEFHIHDLIDSRYPRQKGYEKYFTDNDLCNELTDEGLKFVKNYIKENQLEKDILSKTGKELRGLAKVNKMIKVFKRHYEEYVYLPKC